LLVVKDDFAVSFVSIASKQVLYRYYSNSARPLISSGAYTERLLVHDDDLTYILAPLDPETRKLQPSQYPALKLIDDAPKTTVYGPELLQLCVVSCLSTKHPFGDELPSDTRIDRLRHVLPLLSFPASVVEKVDVHTERAPVDGNSYWPAHVTAHEGRSPPDSFHSLATTLANHHQAGKIYTELNETIIDEFIALVVAALKEGKLSDNVQVVVDEEKLATSIEEFHVKHPNLRMWSVISPFE